ncbi:hypothetical protein E3J95_06955 [Candidatus Aerophobetes bacterium]|uniref:Uncharacterized protein n=1 Tax=Aerophobetes bacterium TaxID=2030807 RepID=A0A523QG07_UNCAE|nr:MAG: hypothetical protein E3J95_06955 [Candidatus Aerophobetes bacterium]
MRRLPHLTDLSFRSPSPTPLSPRYTFYSLLSCGIQMGDQSVMRVGI